MTKTFNNSEWIWKKNYNSDEYMEFYGEFSQENDEKIFLDVSADSVCNVYINHKLVFFKLCSDYPQYKIFDRIDITKYCQAKNQIRIFVWYYGEGNFTYYPSKPGLIFEVIQGNKLLLASNENILCRQDIRYKNEYKKMITLQLGYSFFFDNTVVNKTPFKKSTTVNKIKDLIKNPLSQLKCLKKSRFNIIKQDKNTILIDLQKEEFGFLSLSVFSPCEQTVIIAYGEHIVDGTVRKKIDARDFSVEIHLKKGVNDYTNAFRRIAGRYLEVKFLHEITVEYLGIIPIIYPTTVKPFNTKNDVLQKIYDTSVRTLQLCMHEHYEDCPWREQSMYVMDSRNQMLCGYYAFNEYEFARHNLVLISKGLNNDGLLELTFPSKNTPSIPFFNLTYPIAVNEYVKHTNDLTILNEVLPVIENIISYFTNRLTNENLLATLPYPYWNFYEWSEGSHNEQEIERKKEELYIPHFDLALNCIYILAVKNYCELTNNNVDLNKIRKAVYDNFFDKQSGLFFARKGESYYTELGNSLAILADIVSNTHTKHIAEQLIKENNDMIKITLSMTCFKYDALLKASDANGKFIIEDVIKTYSYMLNNGATSFWETIKGEADFNGAGSLCHGWSAMPVYYLNLLINRN